MTASAADTDPTLARVRRFLLAVFVAGSLGTAAELALLEHFEDPWQLVPLALLGLGLAVLVWYAVARGFKSLRSFQATMALFVAGGFTGLVLHYRGNMEFELEMYPSLSGLKLVWQSLGGATPALAPGTLIGLGLVGLIYTYCHPALVPSAGKCGGQGENP